MPGSKGLFSTCACTEVEERSWDPARYKFTKRKTEPLENIIVTKFGGTSLADAGQFRKVKNIILANPDRRIVVASAPGKRFAEDIKVTDLLLACYNAAADQEPFEEILMQIRDRFKAIIDDLKLTFPIDDEIARIRTHLAETPDADYMASRGEFLNSKILAAYLGFTFVDPAWCVCFDTDGNLDLAMTKRAMRAALAPLSHAVVAGFYGADADDKIHTMTRGGSDITGSLAALAVEASLYENWTDVSGLLAADPRIVENPKSVKYLSYRELRALSYMGASVLHTDAVLPAASIDIPINIKNTNCPEDFGTMIVRKIPKSARTSIAGVAGRKDMAVIQVEKVMVSDGAGFSAIMLDILKRRNIPFEQCLTGIDTITIIMRNDLLEECKDNLLTEIRETLNPDFLYVKENQAMLAVIGGLATEDTDANIKVLRALAECDIEISTINQGAGKLNLLIGVPQERYEDAIKAIHATIE